MSRKYVVVFLKPAYDTVTAGTAEDATRIVRGVISVKYRTCQSNVSYVASGR